MDHNGLQHYKDKVQDLLIKLIKILHEKVIVHPIVEKCQTFTRTVLLDVYRKCLPFLARISENSLIAGGIGFGLGLVVSYWIFSSYYVYYYNNVIKGRTMSGVTFDTYNGLER